MYKVLAAHWWSICVSVVHQTPTEALVFYSQMSSRMCFRLLSVIKQYLTRKHHQTTIESYLRSELWSVSSFDQLGASILWQATCFPLCTCNWRFLMMCFLYSMQQVPVHYRTYLWKYPQCTINMLVGYNGHFVVISWRKWCSINTTWRVSVVKWNILFSKVLYCSWTCVFLISS